MTSFGYNLLGFGGFANRGVPVEASGGTTATASGFLISSRPPHLPHA